MMMSCYVACAADDDELSPSVWQGLLGISKRGNRLVKLQESCHHKFCSITTNDHVEQK